MKTYDVVVIEYPDRGPTIAPGRVELPTSGLGNRCSIRLSYGAVIEV